MSLPLAITLNPASYGGAAGDKVYDLLGYSSMSESTRRVGATYLTTPESLVVKHKEQKVLDCVSDLHLVRLDTKLTDPVKGACQLSSYLNIVVPKGTTVVTDQMIKDQVGRLIALYLAVGNHTRIMQGET